MRCNRRTSGHQCDRRGKGKAYGFRQQYGEGQGIAVPPHARKNLVHINKSIDSPEGERISINKAGRLRWAVRFCYGEERASQEYFPRQGETVACTRRLSFLVQACYVSDGDCSTWQNRGMAPVVGRARRLALS